MISHFSTCWHGQRKLRTWTCHRSNAERSLGKSRWLYTLLSFFLMVFVYYVYDVIDGMLVFEAVTLCAGPQIHSSLQSKLLLSVSFPGIQDVAELRKPVNV